MYIYMCVCVCVCMTLSICMPACLLSHFSHVQFFATPWAAAWQAPLFMEFCRQEYWSGLPFLSLYICVYLYKFLLK